MLAWSGPEDQDFFGRRGISDAAYCDGGYRLSLCLSVHRLVWAQVVLIRESSISPP